MVDLAKKRGQHILDPGPTFLFRARLITDSTIKSTFIRNVEIGCEIQWFHEDGVKPIQLKHPKLGDVNKLEFIG